MTDPMTTTIQDGVMIVEFAPDANLDAAFMDTITPRLYKLMEPGEPLRIAIDFSNVAFVSSQALGSFVTLRLKGARSGKSLAICGVPESLAEIFSLTQLDRLYNIYPTRENAVETLRVAG